MLGKFRGSHVFIMLILALSGGISSPGKRHIWNCWPSNYMTIALVRLQRIFIPVVLRENP